MLELHFVFSDSATINVCASSNVSNLFSISILFVHLSG